MMNIKRVTILHLIFAILVLNGCTSRPIVPSSLEGKLEPVFDEAVEPGVPELVIERTKEPTLEIADPHEAILDHKYFKIIYDTRTRLAKYVTYELRADQLRQPRAKRRNKFMPDPLLVKRKLPFVEPSEYTKSGYDRGHLAPAADFSWNQEAQDRTFVMSNMVPQKPNLNRDAWRRLEERVRRWACGEEHITVVTGPILENRLPKLKSGLPVPQKFFKIVIDETPPKKSIAFVFSQTDKGDVIEQRKIAVSALSKVNGVHLPVGLLNRSGLRSPANLEEWKEKDCR